jgi:hypothetical protein
MTISIQQSRKENQTIQSKVLQIHFLDCNDLRKEIFFQWKSASQCGDFSAISQICSIIIYSHPWELMESVGSKWQLETLIHDESDDLILCECTHKVWPHSFLSSQIYMGDSNN